MNQDKIAEKWPQIKDQVKNQWGKLTEQDLNAPQFNSQFLASKVAERYHETPEQAQQEVQEFSRKLN